MWNLLIVLIIAAVIWMFSAQLNFTGSPNNPTSVKQTTVDEIKNEALNQANEARRLQKEQLDSLNN